MNEEYYVIPAGYNGDGDPIPHSEHGLTFCDDPTCPCHLDAEALEAVNAYTVNGLFTESEASRFIAGKMII